MSADPRYESYTIAFLKSLKFLDYRRIAVETVSRVAGREPVQWETVLLYSVWYRVLWLCIVESVVVLLGSVQWLYSVDGLYSVHGIVQCYAVSSFCGKLCGHKQKFERKEAEV